MQSIEFSTELMENAKIYAAILNQDHELWQKYGPTARQHMNTLNLLQMVQIRPLVLAVLDKFSVKETQNTFRLMTSWAVRFLITGGLGGGTLETYYSQAATDIRSGKIKTASQLNSSLKSIIPSDATFRHAFAIATVSKNYLARYYLRALEKQKRGEKDPELIPNDNAEIVNLEHILPLNPLRGWDHISEDDRAAYTRKIGNMALLKTRINTDAGNDSFDFKKPFYKESKFKLTSSIAKLKKWDTTTINERQEALAALAIETWPLK
jgi:hypothetical protein